MKPIYYILIALAAGILITWYIMDQKAKKAAAVGTVIGAVAGRLFANSRQKRNTITVPPGGHYMKCKVDEDCKAPGTECFPNTNPPGGICL